MGFRTFNIHNVVSLDHRQRVITETVEFPTKTQYIIETLDFIYTERYTERYFIIKIL